MRAYRAAGSSAGPSPRSRSLPALLADPTAGGWPPDVPLSGGMPGISDHFSRRKSTVTKRLAAEMPVFEIPDYPGRVRSISVGQAAHKSTDHEISKVFNSHPCRLID